jgi:Family of unknown function (DUF5681)
VPSKKQSTPRRYAVGYRRPPKASQFRKGKSGNPKGRPKGSRNIGALLAEAIRQKVSVTENGKTRRMSAIEAMLRRLVNEAMRNDPAALKMLLPLIDRYAEADDADVDLDSLLEEDQKILARYGQRNR